MSEALVSDGAARLTIDLDALVANWRQLGDRAGRAECGVAVKADAYGMGLEPAARALAAAGCRTFFVAQAGEAAAVRAVLPDAILYVLNGLAPGSADELRRTGARPVLGSLPELDEWGAASRSAGELLPAALHIDTGMNRLGFPPDQATALARDSRLREIRPTLLMSHLTAAEDPEDPATSRQVADFAAIRGLFPDVPASLANSAGTLRPDVPAYDLVRPGYAVYGGNPQPGRPNPMRAVVRLEVPILQVRDVGAGERVGYNGRWTADRPCRLATLALGYADGFLRTGSRSDTTDAEGLDRSAVLVAGVLCPVLGAISMDLAIVDVTDAPRAERGDRATVIGAALTVDEVGRRAGTIGYEILTALGRRFARHYAGD